MQEDPPVVLTLPADTVPAALREFVSEAGAQAVLASMELLPDGQLHIPVVPEVEPRLVARGGRTLAQYADGLRRLS